MSKLGHWPFAVARFQMPTDVITATEATIGRTLTMEESRVLNELFDTTITFYNMEACRPSLIRVRKWLRWMARHGRILTKIVGPVEHAVIRWRIAAAEQQCLSDEVLRDELLTPAAGEVDKLEAVERLTKEIERRGVSAQDASSSLIKTIAQEEADSLSAMIQRGREPRNDLGIFWGWADLAEHIGIHAGASFKPAKGQHDSPFLRWLRLVSSQMPKFTRKSFEANMGQHVESALQLRREHRIDSGLFEEKIQFSPSSAKLR
jgi:hypothetical protein